MLSTSPPEPATATFGAKMAQKTATQSDIKALDMSDPEEMSAFINRFQGLI